LYEKVQSLKTCEYMRLIPLQAGLAIPFSKIRHRHTPVTGGQLFADFSNARVQMTNDAGDDV
jgi:hypothetical protein